MLLLHGDHIAASRQELSRIKEEFQDEVVVLEGKGLELTDLVQALESQTLFGGQRLVVIENLFSAGKVKKEILAYLKANKSESLSFWEGKQLTASQIKSLGLTQKNVRLFKLPAVIFKFVDSIVPGNQRNALGLLSQVLETEEESFVFHMIVRQFRLMLLLSQIQSLTLNLGAEKGRTGKGPSELKRLAPWQKSRLTIQAGKFSQDMLQRMYRQLFEIEIKLKTGGGVVGLKGELEMFLLAIK